jgi:zinc protease
MLAKVLPARVSASVDGETPSGFRARLCARHQFDMQLLYLRATAPRKTSLSAWRQTAAAAASAKRSQDVVPATRSRKRVEGHLRTIRSCPPTSTSRCRQGARVLQGSFSDFRITFVIVGTIDLAKLKPLVETYLASLPAKGRKEKEKDIGARRPNGVVTKTFAYGSEPKGRVIQTYFGDEAWTHDKERDIYILSRVMTIRLREILREDMSGVYGVRAGGSIARSPHQERTFTVSFGADPKRIDELIKAAQTEIAAIAKAGIGADYLEKIKATYRASARNHNNGSFGRTGFGVPPATTGAHPRSEPVVNRMTTD